MDGTCIDDHYCAALFKYLREYAIKVQDRCTLVFADDKSKIDIGEPGALVSTGVRGKKTLAPVTSQLSALDHDVQSKSSLTPSVTMICEIPDDINTTFYRGDVRVCLKDAVFQASSPFRHAAELSQILKRRGEVPPILFLYTDGGPDHRLTYYSVKCALVCLFIELDLDFLVAARTAPGHSWTNPVERVMSLLNLGIQNVAIARTPTEQMEGTLHSCNSMSDIRKAATTQPALKHAWGQSLKPVLDILNGRFARLSLKGRPVCTEEYAEDAEIDAVMRHIHRIDRTVDLDHLQQKDIEKCDKLKKFLESHTRSRHYSFQIRKCNDATCSICQKHQLDPEQFSKCHWLPDPEPNPVDPNRYMPFTSLFGTSTSDSEKFRPSLIVKAATEDPNRSSQSFTGQRARNIVLCGECLKPRVIYSQYLLTAAETNCIEKIKESACYVCGADFLPEEDSF